MAAGSGLRERKKLATRSALASAALRLTRERGFEAVTVEAISDSAGVSPRTFFNYFASKEEAVLRTDPERRARLLAAVEARPAGEPPLRALRAAFVSMLAQRDTDPDEEAERLVLIRSHPYLFSRYVARYADLERVLAEALARRLDTHPDEDPFPRLVVAAGISAYRVAVDHWHTTGHQTDLGTAVDAAFDQLEAGLQP